MKKLLLLIAFIGFTAYGFSQSMVFNLDGEPLENGATIQVLGDPSTGLNIVAEFTVTNSSDKAISVGARKVINDGDTITGTSNYFCWGLCLPPFTYELSYGIMEAGTTSEEPFQADYMPNLIPGISIITYELWDENNTTDVTSVTVEFNASPAAIDEELSEVSFSAAYPNPANNHVSFDYNISGNKENKVTVSNMLGQIIYETYLTKSAGTLNLNTVDFQEGIYFYTVTSGRELITAKKFIVKH